MQYSRLMTAIVICLMSPLANSTNLVDVYQDARANNPQLSAALANYNSQKQVVPQAKAILLPRIDASVGYQDSQSESNNPFIESDAEVLSYGVSVTQPLFNAQGWHAYKAAQDIESQAEINYLSEEQDILLSSAEAYFNVLLSQDNLRLSIAEEKAVKQQLEQAEQRFNVGLIAVTEVHEAQAAFDNARTQRIARSNDLALSFDSLEALTGKFYKNIQRLSEEIPVDSLTPEPLEKWESQGLQQNYSILSAQFGLKSLGHQVKQEKAGRLPSVNFIGSYQDSDDLTSSGINAQDRETTTFSVELSVPIFTGFGRSSAIRQVRYQEDAASHQLEQTLRTVKQNIRRLHRTINSDKQRISAQKQSIISSQSALEATEIGYEVGTRNIVEVLNAQRVLFASQRDYASVRYDYLLNILRLKAQAGALNAEDLEGLNEWLVTENPINFPI